MEPEINPNQSRFASLTQVTPVSKYLALGLFIILPFLGGYVGYQAAMMGVMDNRTDFGSGVGTEVTMIDGGKIVDFSSCKHQIVTGPFSLESEGTLVVVGEDRGDGYCHTVLQTSTGMGGLEYQLYQCWIPRSVGVIGIEVQDYEVAIPLQSLSKNYCTKIDEWYQAEDAVSADTDTRVPVADVAVSQERLPGEMMYGQFVRTARDQYQIPPEYFSDYTSVYSYQARKVSDSLTLVVVASPDQPAGPIGTVLFDESSKSVVRTVDYVMNTMDVWVNRHTRIVLDWDADYKNRLVIYDYLANTSETLYEESVEGVQLADVCEMGCKGILYVTTDNTLVFGRHERIPGTTATKLIEIKTISIPEEWVTTAY